MSQLDEIIQTILNEKCPVETIIQDINEIEATEENIDKIQEIYNLIEIHEESSRRIRQIIRLKTSKFYRKLLIDEIGSSLI